MATTMNHTVTDALLTSIITTVSHITHLLTTPSILHDVNLLTSSVQLNDQQIYSIHTPTMIVQIQDTNAGDLIFSPSLTTTNTSDANISPITVNLPTPANGRASFIFHTTSQLFPSKDKPDHVISVSLGLGRVPNLKPPLVYSLNNERTRYGRANIPGTLEANYYRQRCVFWDFATSDWSSEGCGLDVTKQPPTCECSHLTNFALLVSVKKVPADFALEIAGKVGCSVCIAAYVAIIIILLLNKKIRNKTSTKIQLHVCFNLMVAYLLFMIGVPSVGNKTTCTIVAVLLHYTFLTSWFWMGIYSNRLYVCLVKVFPRPTTNYTWKSSIFAYGVPLIIVSINAGLTLGVLDKQRANHDIIQTSNPQYLPPSYYRADNVCWLHSWSLYFGFLLFVGIILLNNLVVFVLVLNQLCWRESEIRSSANKQRKSHKVMLACSMIFMLGLTWMVGFLMVFSTNVVYNKVTSWLFTICITLQGIVMFYVTCVRRKDILTTWWLPIGRAWAGVYDSMRSQSRGLYDVQLNIYDGDTTSVMNQLDDGEVEEQQVELTTFTRVGTSKVTDGEYGRLE
uniref:adhesion G-protein coupled receptor G7-like n=1 Tax=Ciona intestinalis TaxID=7719 RepID=UPI000EF4DF74|nr:adhesion G-protein coupled receptor G7-like [Ciona intestinalis]|eukprot:XP_018671421.2 adhesion G-protein coupled receptor G7-like [Ciona intestinalis]